MAKDMMHKVYTGKNAKSVLFTCRSVPNFSVLQMAFETYFLKINSNQIKTNTRAMLLSSFPINLQNLG